MAVSFIPSGNLKIRIIKKASLEFGSRSIPETIQRDTHGY